MFFQNEMPYDAPDQAAWQHDGVLGYAAYKVADGVQPRGLGDGQLHLHQRRPVAAREPRLRGAGAPGVRFHDLLTVSLNHAGTIDHVINDTGAPVTPDFQGPSNVVSYP